MVAYVQDFRLMFLISLAAMPLILLLRPPRRAPAKGALHAVE